MIEIFSVCFALSAPHSAAIVTVIGLCLRTGRGTRIVTFPCHGLERPMIPDNCLAGRERFRLIIFERSKIILEINKLPFSKQVAVVSPLVEGNSIGKFELTHYLKPPLLDLVANFR